MKKYLLRILVGLFAFGIGLNLTWLSYSIASFEISCANFCVISNLKRVSGITQNGKVEIKFIGFEKKENYAVAKFEILNNSPNSIHYWTLESDKSPSVRIMFNNEIDEPHVYCGMTRFDSNHLHSGESIVLEVHQNSFWSYYENEGEIKVGYSFKTDKEKEPQLYWSDKVTIPNWVKKNIEREKLSYRK